MKLRKEVSETKVIYTPFQQSPPSTAPIEFKRKRKI